MAREPLHCVLIGGGLAGGLLAATLGQAGLRVDLYERRPDPEAGQSVGGRSINLAVSTRGISALQRVGLADEVLAQAIPMRGRMIHSRDGSLHYQPYDKDPARCINSVGRGALNRITIAAARRMPNVRVHFNQRCIDADLDRPAASLFDGDAGCAHDVAGDLLIGVDGAFSAVRRAMQRLDRFDYRQDYLAHGYKELTIPPASDGGFRMERHALHIWPRHSFMMIALPNPDGSFTCTLFYPFDGPRGFASIRGDDDVRRFFEEQFPDAVPLMPTLLEDFRRNPTGSMVTVRCRPWRYRDRVVLVGDAAHAVVPFYGQGANAGFEDVAELDDCLRGHGGDVERALAEYEARRKPNTDALAELALANFVEMRDKTASRAFRAYKRLDRTLHRLLPGWYTPLYTLVSFTTTPYAEALRRATRQDRAVFGSLALLAIVAVALGLAFCLL
ncbi:MAG: FAD-dependent monooxygenase [Phycisphaerae bacterium]|nr:FAD-dependent monooxygenase [Phycisphaerae bacterium]MCZ2398742.1 FAD-dependent monooxygenase [Phycisphaerae bacterium]NUQ48602.1 FAD-dependent monooxygenase [Phycisphaerae bacterium]